MTASSGDVTYGIDFGTTNTVILDPDMYLPGGDVQPTVVVLDPQGGPSNLGQKQGFTEAGREAWNDRADWINGGYHFIRSIKTFLAGDQTWKCQGASNGPPEVWRPCDVAEVFLLHLKATVAADPQARPLNRAVFTLPNGTSPARRKLLRRAAAAAGIEVTGFVSESTAALLASLETLQNDEFVAVFDWGGGTLDISVLQLAGPRIIERSVSGYAKAGDEVDERLARYAFARRSHDDQTAAVAWDQLDPRGREQWRVIIEQTKRELSGGIARLDLLEELHHAPPVIVDVTLTADDLREVCKPLVQEAADALIQAVNDAGIARAELRHVLLVGGSSNLPGVEEAIVERFADTMVQWPPSNIPAERAVAAGAVRAGSNGARYELAEHVDAILSGGGRLHLARPGDWSGIPKVQTRLAVIEDSQHAELPVVTRGDSPGAADRYAGSVCTQTLGFNRERLRLEARTTPDMTVRVELGSEDGIAKDRGVLELDTLRFAYVL